MQPVSPSTEKFDRLKAILPKEKVLDLEVFLFHKFLFVHSLPLLSLQKASTFFRRTYCGDLMLY